MYGHRVPLHVQHRMEAQRNLAYLLSLPCRSTNVNNDSTDCDGDTNTRSFVSIELIDKTFDLSISPTDFSDCSNENNG